MNETFIELIGEQPNEAKKTLADKLKDDTIYINDIKFNKENYYSELEKEFTEEVKTLKEDRTCINYDFDYDIMNEISLKENVKFIEQSVLKCSEDTDVEKVMYTFDVIFSIINEKLKDFRKLIEIYSDLRRLLSNGNVHNSIIDIVGEKIVRKMQEDGTIHLELPFIQKEDYRKYIDSGLNLKVDDYVKKVSDLNAETIKVIDKLIEDYLGEDIKEFMKLENHVKGLLFAFNIENGAK